MNKRKNKDRYMALISDIADSVSFNEETAEAYFAEEWIDIDKYVSRGMEQISSLIKKNTISNVVSIKGRKDSKSKLYFKRAVLAAEIASQLYEEPTFGHVKFQKIVYLGEQLCELRADESYSKQAAGPYDRKFMHSIDNQFKIQKWFDVEVEKKGNFSKFKYKPLENLSKYKKYYENYFSEFNKEIQWLIDTFRKQKTDNVELIATLFYCWKEILESNEEFSEQLLIDNFYKWSKEKGKFSNDSVKNGIVWMKENELVPFM